MSFQLSFAILACHLSNADFVRGDFGLDQS